MPVLLNVTGSLESANCNLIVYCYSQDDIGDYIDTDLGDNYETTSMLSMHVQHRGT